MENTLRSFITRRIDIDPISSGKNFTFTKTPLKFSNNFQPSTQLLKLFIRLKITLFDFNSSSIYQEALYPKKYN